LAQPCDVDRGLLVHLSRWQPEFDELAETLLGSLKAKWKVLRQARQSPNSVKSPPGVSKQKHLFCDGPVMRLNPHELVLIAIVAALGLCIGFGTWLLATG
jgi:hypothetical protein